MMLSLCGIAKANLSIPWFIIIGLFLATTVVAFPNGKVYINTKGNSGMATAGSGDALAGILGSCIASGIDFEDAVLNGVYLHSAAGDAAAEKLGKKFMSATDIIKHLRFVL